MLLTVTCPHQDSPQIALPRTTYGDRDKWHTITLQPSVYLSIAVGFTGIAKFLWGKSALAVRTGGWRNR